MRDQRTCPHEHYSAEVRVTRLDGVYTQVSTLKCSDCNLDFVYPGGALEHVIPVMPRVFRKKPALLALSGGLKEPVHADTPEHPGLPPAA